MQQSFEGLPMRRPSAKPNLEKCAFGVAEKYRTGELQELQELGWPVAWRYLLKDLRNDCPGFTEIEYGIALNQAFIKA